MIADLRYAARVLRRNALSSTVIVLLLAVGIGANTVIFSLVNALLLRPLPVERPEELVQFYSLELLREDTFAAAVCDAVHANPLGALKQVACEASFEAGFSDGGPAQAMQISAVSPEYFSLLGVPAMLGHLPGVGDPESAAVLSYATWQQRFQADASVLGRTIRLNRQPFTVVAVLPEGFNGIQADTGPEIRVPLRAEGLLNPDPPEMPPGYRYFSTVFGRLRDGHTPAEAQAQLEAVVPTLDLSYDLGKIEAVSIATGSSMLRDRFAGALRLLMAGVAGLLLIVCANAGGLLLSRAAARSREISVRIAVGASRGQLLRQVIAEAGLLCGIGGALGVALAYLAMPLVMRALPPLRDRAAELHPLRLDVSPDVRVLAFTLAACVATALLFAIAPSIETMRTGIHDALKSARSSPRTSRLRGALVTVQVALCTLLLMGAGLLVRTLSTLRDLDPGFDADHVVTFSLDLRFSGYDAPQAEQLERRLLEQAKALPGVESAAFAGRGLMRGTGVKSTVSPEGQPPEEGLNTSMNAISSDYFKTMGMRLLAGRALAPDEPRTQPEKIVVNEAFARHFFPGQQAIGKRLASNGKPTAVIVGVVNNTKYRSLREAMLPIYYFAGESDPRGVILHLRTAGDPGALIPTVNRLLRSLDPQLSFYEVHTLNQEIDGSLWQERVVAWLSSIFGCAAALLAGIGLYGMLAYAVAQRRREIGIRMALGAVPAAIARLVSMQAAVPVAAGLLLGIAAFAASARWIESVLYGVTTWDAAALGGALLFVAVVATAAVAVPARQALRLDPAPVLREEA